MHKNPFRRWTCPGSTPVSALLLTATLPVVMAACGSQADVAGTWVQYRASGDEIAYLNTQYIAEGSPIVAETLTVWRPEPELTYQIKDHRKFWCDEKDVAMVDRWVSENGGPFKKRDISADMRRRKSVREFDNQPGGLGTPPNGVANLHRKVCDRSFGERVADPLADFESLVR